jgi:hypothetical protein
MGVADFVKAFVLNAALLVSGTVGCGGGHPHAAAPMPPNPAPRATPGEPSCVPFAWHYAAGSEHEGPTHAGGLFVPIELEGQTYQFQFDTGADVTTIYGTDLAKTHGWALEQRGDHPWVRVSGSFAGHRFQHRPFIVYPDMPGGDEAGTIGMDLLVDRVTVVDFPAQRVCVHDDMPEDIERRATFAPAVLDHDRLFMEGTLAAHDYKRLLFDTGSSRFAINGSLDSWKRWTGLNDEAGATERVQGTAWGHEIHMLGAPAIGSFTVAGLSVEHPMAFYCKEQPDPFAGWPMPTDAVIGNAAFLNRAIVLDARRTGPRFGVATTQ